MVSCASTGPSWPRARLFQPRLLPQLTSLQHSDLGSALLGWRRSPVGPPRLLLGPRLWRLAPPRLHHALCAARHRGPRAAALAQGAPPRAGPPLSRSAAPAPAAQLQAAAAAACKGTCPAAVSPHRLHTRPAGCFTTPPQGANLKIQSAAIERVRQAANASDAELERRLAALRREWDMVRRGARGAAPGRRAAGRDGRGADGVLPRRCWSPRRQCVRDAYYRR